MSSEYPSTTLVLVRHGQARASDGSYGPETGLSELGRRQATGVAKAIANGVRPVAVYTSPWTRAAETAYLVCDQLGLNAVVDSRIAEFDLGSGSLEAALLRPDLAFWKPEHRSLASGENLNDFSARVAAFCAEIVERHLGGRVVIVAHGGSIAAAIRWAVGITPTSHLQHEFGTKNGSITVVEFWPRGIVPGGSPQYAALGPIGDVAHLRDMLSEL